MLPEAMVRGEFPRERACIILESSKTSPETTRSQKVWPKAGLSWRIWNQRWEELLENGPLYLRETFSGKIWLA